MNINKRLSIFFIKGQRVSEISKNYDIFESTIYKWILWYKNTGSFKTNDQKTPEEIQIVNLQKRIKELETENKILKAASVDIR